MLYSKNGSIPKTQTDDTDGWIEVDEPPVAADGQEVVWWFPPGWVVRPVQPADEEGFKWSWSQSSEQWVKCAVTTEIVVELGTPITPPTTSGSDTISGA